MKRHKALPFLIIMLVIGFLAFASCQGQKPAEPAPSATATETAAQASPGETASPSPEASPAETATTTPEASPSQTVEASPGESESPGAASTPEVEGSSPSPTPSVSLVPVPPQPSKKPVPTTPRKPGKPIQGKVKVGLIAATRDEGRVYDAFKKLEKQGKVELIFRESGQDAKKQLAEAKKMLTDKIDTLVMCPRNPYLAEKAVLMADKKKVPVFIFQIPVEQGDVVSQICFNMSGAGQEAARRLAKDLQGKGKVLILKSEFLADKDNMILAFEKEIKKHPGITLVDTAVAESDKKSPDKEVPEILKRYPDISGIFAMSGEISVRAAQEIASGKEPYPVLIGYGGHPEAQKAIVRYPFYKGDIINKVDQMGQLTTDTVMKFLVQGREVPRKVYVNLEFLDKKYIREKTPGEGPVVEKNPGEKNDWYEK